MLQSKVVGVFGVPDMGKVCGEKHAPNFMKNVSGLHDNTGPQVLCLTAWDDGCMSWRLDCRWQCNLFVPRLHEHHTAWEELHTKALDHCMTASQWDFRSAALHAQEFQ